MPNPSAWNNFVKPTHKAPNNRRPSKYDIAHSKHTIPARRRNLTSVVDSLLLPQNHQHLRQPEAQTRISRPLWNGFINVPRCSQRDALLQHADDDGYNIVQPSAAGGGGQPRTVVSQQPTANNAMNNYNYRCERSQLQQHNTTRVAAADKLLAPNPRFLARLNNDLKQLWETSPPSDRNAYTPSTSMPAFSDVQFSGSLFRQAQHQPQHQPPQHQHHYLAPRPQRSPETPTMQCRYDDSFFSSAAPQTPAVSSANLADGANFTTVSDFFAGLESPTFGRTNTVVQRLSICRRDAISIRPLEAVRSSSSSSPYDELCQAVRVACGQAREALYADGNFTDLAALRREARRPIGDMLALSAATSRSVDVRTTTTDDGGQFEFDACPFSPMTAAGSCVDAPMITMTSGGGGGGSRMTFSDVYGGGSSQQQQRDAVGDARASNGSGRPSQRSAAESFSPNLSVAFGFEGADVDEDVGRIDSPLF